MVIIPMVAISMSSLVKKEIIILVTCITRIIEEIITIIICFATFKQVASVAFVQNVQLYHIFKIDKLMLRKDPLHCWYCIIDMTK